MHPGMTDAAERDEVLQVVVRGVVVDVVDVEVLSPPAADRASLPVAFKHGAPNLLPPREAVLLPRGWGGLESFAVDEGPAPPHGKRAAAAEPAKTVPDGIVPAKRGGARTIKRVQAELNVGAHDLKKVGCGTG